MDVVPVKNEEGLVIMFILDFQQLIDRALAKSSLRQRVAQGWIYCNPLTVCFFSFSWSHLRELLLRRSHFLSVLRIPAVFDMLECVALMLLWELKQRDIYSKVTALRTRAG